MSKEKETEKIINHKLNSREFDFDEKAWAGMETLLDAQQKKRRFGFWWYFSASMFVVLVAGAAWFLNSRQDLKGYVVLEKNNNALNKSETVSGKSNAEINKSNTVLEKSNTALEKNETVSGKSKAEINKSDTVLEKNNTALEKNETVSEKSNTVLNQNSAVSEQKDTFSAELAADSAKTAEQTFLTDSASLAETAKNSLTAPGKETKNAWGVLAGSGFWYQYQQTPGATNQKGGFPFTGGIYYQRSLSKRFELGLSLLYSSRGALNFDKTIANSNYGFGIESDLTTISPQTLHYLNIPLHFRFNLSQRSHIKVGASYYQLLATTSKVTHTIESSFASTFKNTEKQTGEHKGFRKNDIAAFIGYELTLFDRMNAGLQISYGFYDNTVNGNNGSFNGADSFDRNISLQLELKYDLFCH